MLKLKKIQWNKIVTLLIIISLLIWDIHNYTMYHNPPRSKAMSNQNTIDFNAQMGNYNHQYIGARYVPLFFEGPNGSSEWVSGIPYQALTIVTYLGNSFTSKIPVPANIGNPAQNPTYWVATGSYNAQIEAYRKQVAELNTDINILKDKYLIITDSYGGNFGNTITPYTTYFAQELNLTAGIDYVVGRMDGAGFVSNGRLFIDVLEQTYNNWSYQLKTEEITNILVLGGCNDAGITSGISSAITQFKNMALNLFPNAKIYIGVIGGFNNLTQKQNLAKNVLTTYYDSELLPLPNLNYVMQNRNYFQEDNTHPNQTGMIEIGKAVAAAVKKGYVNITKPITDNANLMTDATSGLLQYTVQSINDLLNITIRTPTIIQFPAKNIEGNIIIGSINCPYFFGDIAYQTTVAVSYGTTTGTQNAISTITIINGDIYLALLNPIENVTAININRCYMTMSRNLT